MSDSSWMMLMVGVACFVWFTVYALRDSTVPPEIRLFAWLGIVAVIMGFIVLPVVLVETS